jgi:hypothetical protein
LLRRRGVFIAAVLALAGIVAGCADSGFQYVKSSEDRTYFKVPDRWTLFDEDAIMERFGAGLTEAQRAAELEQSWRVAFDASPKPSVNNVLRSRTKYPAGLAIVRPLSFDAADTLSNSSLRNLFVDIDSAQQDGTGEIQEYEELQLDGGFRGIHVVATIDTGNGRPVTVDQTALVDQATTKLYVLLITCSSVCYDKNRRDIEQVVGSWTVRAK